MVITLMHQAAKPTPRQIRRAFGPQAVGLIDQHAQTIADLQQRVRAQGEFIADLSVKVDALQQKLTFDVAFEQSERHAIGSALFAHMHRGFWGRLRWLVTGR